MFVKLGFVVSLISFVLIKLLVFFAKSTTPLFIALFQPKLLPIAYLLIALTPALYPRRILACAPNLDFEFDNFFACISLIES